VNPSLPGNFLTSVRLLLLKKDVVPWN
jgi:hypothetical protein